MEALTQTFTVLFIAIVVALLMALIIKAIVIVLGRQGAQPTRAAATAPADLAAGGPSASVADGSPPPHHVAAIAAALSVVMDEPQIVHIATARQGSGWTAEGRSAHRASHDTGRGSRSTRR